MEAHITGIVAKTTMLISFKPPSTLQSVEADLTFPLPEVDGVITSKEKAQIAFENAVRSKIPGKIASIEHVDGSIFRAKIYPVRQKGRLVKISWTSRLQNYSYSLPLKFANSIDRVKFNIIIDIPYMGPVHESIFRFRSRFIFCIDTNRSQFSSEELKDNGFLARYIAHTEQQKTKLSSGVKIDLPKINFRKKSSTRIQNVCTIFA
eukprot:TRINITY_DN5925_c0_g1_i1.p1 TRINITY_DN5925_c0_g1~~TRINITY_DN5925_c0_g1_i1.p1  ORF type:complete len:235 (+),score=19.39 TRINITY_DN5925_c0_g1_i1:90-707(+)